MIAISIGNGSGDAQGSQRGLEYDTMSGRYAEFVETEVLPLVEKQFNVRLTKDPDARATMGCSSGGSAALAMAWYRTDLYHRVLTYSGTYVNQQWPWNPETPGGAWDFHKTLIPNSPKKPIRLWMHVSDRDNFNDSDGMHDWVLANQLMAKVLADKGYDYQFLFTQQRRPLRPRRQAADAAAGARVAVEGLPRRAGEVTRPHGSGRTFAPHRPRPRRRAKTILIDEPPSPVASCRGPPARFAEQSPWTPARTTTTSTPRVERRGWTDEWDPHRQHRTAVDRRRARRLARRVCSAPGRAARRRSPSDRPTSWRRRAR